MSVRSSVFHGEAQGHFWHAWTNGMRGRDREGVFVEANRPYGPGDEWGYRDLEVDVWHAEADEPGAEVTIHLPLEICEAIAKWVSSRKSG